MNILYQWFKHNNTALATIFALFLLPLAVFFQLADKVIENEAIPFDVHILRWLHNSATPFFDMLFYIFTTLGSLEGVVIITGYLAFFFLHKNQRERTLLLLASVGGAVLANILLKVFIERDRPRLFETFIVETSYSFPSGHAMASSALAACLVLLYWRTKWRWPITTIAILFALLVGVSRPYFGVHYPSDIIAGWCASTVWVLLVFYTINRFRLKTSRSRDTRLT